MRLDYFEVSKNDNLLSPSAELFLSNLNIFRQSLGSAIQTFHRILKMTLLSSTRRHLRMNPNSNPFRKDDIAVYIKITGYQLVRVLKTKPQFCFVFASDGKTKTVHCSLLCLVFRPQSGCSSFTDQLQNDQDDDNNDNNVIIQPEEEMQQKCIFSHFISQRLGYHHDAGSECLLPASCPVTTCDTGPGPAWPGSDPAPPRKYAFLPLDIARNLLTLLLFLTWYKLLIFTGPSPSWKLFLHQPLTVLMSQRRSWETDRTLTHSQK